MSAARAAIGNYCFKKSKKYILKKCGWMSVDNIILSSSLKFIHNTITNKMPVSVYNLFKINKRKGVDIVPIYRPKTQKIENFIIYTGIRKYNKLPNYLKDKRNFKKELKQHLMGISDDTYD